MKFFAFIRRSAPAVYLGWLSCVSCGSVPLLPPTDLTSSGWNIQSGQAAWQPPGHRAELIGDLLLATNVNGDFFAQLTKSPFTLVTAEIASNQWQIAFGANSHIWHGQGEPPDRFVWFQLPIALRNGKIAEQWQFNSLGTNAWRITNKSTEEALEGGFFP